MSAFKGRHFEGEAAEGSVVHESIAGRRCLLAASEVGGVALLTDGKNERVAAWYAGYEQRPPGVAARSPASSAVLPASR